VPTAFNVQPPVSWFGSQKTRIARVRAKSWIEIAESVNRLLIRKLTSRSRERRWKEFRANGTEFVFAKRAIAMVLCTNDSAISRDLYVNGEHEFRSLERALKLLGLNQLQVLVDVGANVGEVCIRAVKKGLTKRAIAIEADPLNFQLLSINAGLNGLTRTQQLELHHAAAGSGTPSYVRMKKSLHNYGDHQVLSDPQSLGAPEDRDSRVRNLRLDELNVSNFDPPALLWIDVQGYETQVLQGAKNLLTNAVAIAVEISPSHLELHSFLSDFMNLIGHYRGYFDLHLHNPSLQPLKFLERRYIQLRETSRHTDILLV